jgi:hypothetical protein
MSDDAGARAESGQRLIYSAPQAPQERPPLDVVNLECGTDCVGKNVMQPAYGVGLAGQRSLSGKASRHVEGTGC